MMDVFNQTSIHPKDQSLGSSLGLIILGDPLDSMKNTYWSSMITSLNQYAALEGFKLSIYTVSPKDTPRQLIQKLAVDSSLSGFIIGADHMTQSCLDPLLKENRPFVLIGQIPEKSYLSVDVDNRASAQMLTEYMISKGYQKICFFSAPLDTEYSLKRCDGYRYTMKLHGLESRVITLKNLQDSEIKTSLEFMEKTWPELDGILFAAGGEFLLQVFWMIKAINMDITPLGISVFDDYPFMEHLDPALTALKQPLDEMALKAVQLIKKLLRGEKPDQLVHILPTSIVARNSCREFLSR